MAQAKNILFYKWYIDWYLIDGIEEMIIFMSLPSILTKPIEDKGDTIILDIFEKRHQNVDAKKYLQKIVDKANYYGVTICAEPIPRLYNIKSEEHKKKLTKEYLISYYETFGFSKNEHGFMVKKPNISSFNK